MLGCDVLAARKFREIRLRKINQKSRYKINKNGQGQEGLTYEKDIFSFFVMRSSSLFLVACDGDN